MVNVREPAFDHQWMREVQLYRLIITSTSIMSFVGLEIKQLITYKIFDYWGIESPRVIIIVECEQTVL